MGDTRGMGLIWGFYVTLRHPNLETLLLRHHLVTQHRTEDSMTTSGEHQGDLPGMPSAQREQPRHAGTCLNNGEKITAQSSVWHRAVRRPGPACGRPW